MPPAIPEEEPCVMVNPLTEALKPEPKKLPKLNIRLALLPLMVKRFAPGPVIVIAPPLGANNSPEVNVIVCGELNNELNTIVSSPGVATACVNASRRLPAPLSFVLVTVNVAAAAFIAEIASIITAIVNVFLK